MNEDGDALKTKTLIYLIKRLNDAARRQQRITNYILDELRADLVPLKAGPLAALDGPDGAGEEVFSSLAHAAKYLRSAGYKIGKTRLYRARQSGLLRMEADGISVNLRSLLEYACSANLKTDR